MSTQKQIIIGAIKKSPSEISDAFSRLIKTEVLSRIEAKRAEVGANLLQNLQKS